MSHLPEGTLTFLLTDLEGSTRLWERHPDVMETSLARHDALLTESIQRHRGLVIRSRGEGDSFFSVFASATDALHAAAALQRALAAEPWPPETELRVRAALLTGEAHLRDGDYFGSDINRCARLRAIAHGGQTLVSESVWALVRDALPEGLSLRDLGRHRLRDLQRPEHVFQLLGEELPRDFPPLTSLDALPNNLPQQLSSFIGREKEIAELRGLLGRTRLLTITGTGGGGKTRLALQVAADVLEEFPDGVWLAELGALQNPELVPQSVAQAIGVREEGGQPVQERLREHTRTRALLLVLDNCEHLIEASARLVDDLLRHSPRLRVLATSREPLNLPGEVAWRIPSLSLPDVKRLPRLRADAVAALARHESVRLFQERALAASPRFVLTERNAAAVATICHQLDGIPLAIELAAARLRFLTVEQVAGRLQDRFRLLAGGSRTAFPRHQTLQAAIDWSYDLLSTRERELMRRLAVFTGGWFLEAAERVCGGGEVTSAEVMGLLGQLVDKSLVVADTSAARETRYRLLETVRQYAAARMQDAGEAETYLRRHRDEFLSLAGEAEEKLRGVEQAAWMDRLDTEHDNLRTALEFSLVAADGAEPALLQCVYLFRFWYVRGYLSEGRGWLERALARRAEAPRSTAARALNAAGSLACPQGDYEAANRYLQEALDAWRSAEDRHGIAIALNNLGMVARGEDDLQRTRRYYEESLQCYRQIGQPRGAAAVLGNLAAALVELGEPEAALPLNEEALELQRGLGDRWMTAVSTRNLADLLHRLGQPERARALYLEALPAVLALRAYPSVAHCLMGLALVECELGAWERAARLLGAVEAAQEERGFELPTAEHAASRDCAAVLRRSLGEDGCEAAWQAGRVQSLEQAARQALDTAGA